MSDWTVDEHLTAGGHSYFAEFVAGLADAQDVKDAAVLVGALRALGNRLREPRSKALEAGLFELRGTKGADLLRFFAWQARRSSRWVCNHKEKNAAERSPSDA